MVETSIDIDWSFIAIVELLSSRSFNTVLDIGSGDGNHSAIFRQAKKEVVSIDKFHDKADVKVDLLDYKTDRKFDCIFCSHVIEHQRNAGIFLDKIHSLLSDDGILCISGPCHSPDILIEGHLMVWTAILGIQALVMAGFNCTSASIYQLYETGIICKKAKNFDVESASYQFNNLDLWPRPPKSGTKWVTERGVFAQNMTPIPFNFSKSGEGQIYKCKVKDCDENYHFKISNRRFTNDSILFSNE